MLTQRDLTLQTAQTIVQEVTTTCNLRCPTCRVTQSNQKPYFMGFSEFTQICHNITPYIRQARVYNISSSESLLHPRCFDMIDIVKHINPNIFVSIITNGMLLDDRKQVDLLRRGIKAICVSIDGAKRETVEKIRIGSNFDTILKNIRGFISKGGMVRTIYTVRDNNIGDLVEFVGIADDLGIWLIKCTGLITYTQDDVKHGLYSWEGLPEVERVFQEAAEKAKSKKIEFTYKPTKIVADDGYCCLATTMYVGVQGDISPCVYLSEPTSLSLFDKTRKTEPMFWGNVMEKPINQIWLSDESLTFRQGIMNGDNCDLCGMKYVQACGMPKDPCKYPETGK